MHLGADERGKLRQDHVIASRFAHPCPGSQALSRAHRIFSGTLGMAPTRTPCLISFKPIVAPTCWPMRALETETQNLCGILELQAYSKAIWLGRFSDYQVGRQECHGPVGGHGDIHQKDNYHETAVCLSHWSGVELGYVHVFEFVQKPKLF